MKRKENDYIFETGYGISNSFLYHVLIQTPINSNNMSRNIIYGGDSTSLTMLLIKIIITMKYLMIFQMMMEQIKVNILIF